MNEKIKALNKYIESLELLYNCNILKNKKDFTGQIGEWLVEELYDGSRAKSGVQKGWDVVANNKFFQIKTHSKSDTNKNRWSSISLSEVNADFLIIVVFSNKYKLKEFYKVPWTVVLNRLKKRGKKQTRNEINWSDIIDFKIELTKLPKQEIIKFLI